MSKQKSFIRRMSLLLSLAMLLCLLPITATAAPIGANEGKKDLAVYFGNWNVHEDATKTVENIPWDKVTTINHAFWEIVPTPKLEAEYADKLNAEVWKVNGGTPFTIRTTEQEADFGGKLESGADFAGHFAAYEEMYAKYPDVAVFISIGGWTRSGMFSEMASTEANRAVFIQSCIDALKEYPWLAGIDLDWEYPAYGETAAGRGDDGDPANQGCPSRPEDDVNYTALIKELRAALDKAFPNDYKQITICIQASGWSINGGGQAGSTGIAYQLDKIIETLDKINIMTYDWAGGWTPVSHHTNPYVAKTSNKLSTEESIQFFVTGALWNSVNLKYPEKLNIGFGAYSRAWWLDVGGTVDKAAFDALKQGDSLEFLMGTPAGTKGTLTENETNLYYKLAEFEAAAKAKDGSGWIYWLDESAKAPLLTNNNPESEWYGIIHSYDNLVSVAEKAKLIEKYGMGGIILWATYGDSNDETSLIAAMNEGLKPLSAQAKSTFDANGGTGTSSVVAKVGTTIALPSVNPTYAGHIFKGWYTAASGGSKLSATIKVPATSVVYYAQWTQVTVGKGKTPTLSNTKAGVIRVKYSKVSGAAGYRVKVSTSSKFATAKSGTKVYAGYVKNEIKSCKGVKLKKGTTYYVKVRAFKLDSTGAKVWGAYSNTKSIKIAK